MEACKQRLTKNSAVFVADMVKLLQKRREELVQDPHLNRGNKGFPQIVESPNLFPQVTPPAVVCKIEDLVLNFGHSYTAALEMMVDFSKQKRGSSLENSVFSSISLLKTCIKSEKNGRLSGILTN